MTTEREISSEEQQLLADADVWFDDHQAQITSELLDLVNISSVSDNSQPQTGQPYGKGVREVFDHVIAKALEWGFSINDYDGHAISVNYPIINDKNKLHQDQDIALVSHLDVVPPGDGWDWPAFQAFEKDGYIVGRGTADNKGAAIVDLFLLQFFNSQQHQFKHRIRVLLGGAEETTLDDMTYVVEHYGAPYQAIITDSPFPVNNAQKGHLDIDVIIPAGPIISGFSVGSSYNSVPGSASLVLRDIPLITVAKAFSALDSELTAHLEIQGLENSDNSPVAVTATGIPGHAAFPDGSLNAAWLLFDALSKTSLLTGQDATTVATLATWLSTPYGDGTGIAFEDDASGRTTQNIGVIRSTGAELIIHFDVRYAVTQTAASILSTLEQKAKEVGGRLGDHSDSKPYFVSADDPRIQLLLSTFDAIMGTHSAAISMGGGTHARVIPNAINFGPGFIRGYVKNSVRPISQPPQFIKKGKGSPHGADEWVSLEDLKSAFLIYTLALFRLDEAL